MIDVNEITQQMSDLDEAALLQSLAEVINAGPESALAALQACQAGLEQVGKRFETQEYFLSDLIYAGELMTDAAALLKPALAEAGTATLGKLVICTVKGDIHDIGKNIVVTMLGAAGFDVIDLGVDVAPEVIVQTAIDNDVKIIGLSSVLTLAVDSIQATVDAFVAAGLRDQVKIIIGGNPVSATVCEKTGADAWAHNPQDGVTICRGWAS
ncbi:MAG: cobalamin-dependent protein [Coriobacteriales bacterium]|jgi:methylmalonyl-CoA mutase cobalamin-binding domain/chain|nr:cobalamin-dependent protein [Coriobacteriales bacterium]